MEQDSPKRFQMPTFNKQNQQNTFEFSDSLTLVLFEERLPSRLPFEYILTFEVDPTQTCTQQGRFEDKSLA